MKFLLSFTLLLGLVSCSGSKSTTDVGESTGIELADADEFTTDTGDVIAESMPGAVEETGEPALAMEDPMMAAPANSQPVTISADQQVYTVEKNETLMIIAFKLYGDYGKWKELAQWNTDVLNGSNSISAGMQLKYMAPQTPFSWNPSGNPYLIKTGDTLGTISTDTYGVAKYWKDIWNNNKPLIKDPNKIFAGFTIYTPVIEGRDVAFESL